VFNKPGLCNDQRMRVVRNRLAGGLLPFTQRVAAFVSACGATCKPVTPPTHTHTHIHTCTRAHACPHHHHHCRHHYHHLHHHHTP
jgi:hypothetical protein